MNNEQLVLDTWYAGKIKLSRAMIREINPKAGNNGVLYEGPLSLDEWETKDFNENGQQKPAWAFKNNALHAKHPYTIGKDLEKLPDLVSIKFNATWKTYPSFYFTSYTKRNIPIKKVAQILCHLFLAKSK